jgi:hypothetical protein
MAWTAKFEVSRFQRWVADQEERKEGLSAVVPGSSKTSVAYVKECVGMAERKGRQMNPFIAG